MLLARGGEKELFLNTTEHSVLLNKSLLSEDILPEPIWGKENIYIRACIYIIFSERIDEKCLLLCSRNQIARR